jgi:hypothetical protein
MRQKCGYAVARTNYAQLVRHADHRPPIALTPRNAEGPRQGIPGAGLRAGACYSSGTNVGVARVSVSFRKNAGLAMRL